MKINIIRAFIVVSSIAVVTGYPIQVVEENICKSSDPFAVFNCGDKNTSGDLFINTISIPASKCCNSTKSCTYDRNKLTVDCRFREIHRVICHHKIKITFTYFRYPCGRNTTPDYLINGLNNTTTVVSQKVKNKSFTVALLKILIKIFIVLLLSLLSMSCLVSLFYKHLRHAYHKRSTSSGVTRSVAFSTSSLASQPMLPPLLTPVHIPNSRVWSNIPKSARQQACSQFTNILEEIVRYNFIITWKKLFFFATRHLQEDQSFSTANTPTTRYDARHRNTCSSPHEDLARKITVKMKNGDIKGAVKLASSENILADYTDETYNSLCSNHPPPYTDQNILLSYSEVTSWKFEITNKDVVRAIKSFPCNSAGGRDKLSPQHLRDLLQHVGQGSITECPFLSALAKFCELVLRGETPDEVRTFFFGGSLVALRDKNGGNTSIVVGCTLRRLVAKLANQKVADSMTHLLAPTQLGFRVRGGSEVAIHAARCFLSNMNDTQALVKLEFKNAFNSVRRDCVLKAVQSHCPALYNFIYSIYTTPTSLRLGDKVVDSVEGIQEGDPLAPLLLCLVLHQHCLALKSAYKVLLLGEVMIGGDLDTLQHDIQVMKEAVGLGLSLDMEKCVIFSKELTTHTTLMKALYGTHKIIPRPEQALEGKLKDLKRLGEVVKLLSAHDALLLLQHWMDITKLTHILRTTPCYKSPVLESFDDCLCEIVSAVTNNELARGSPAWKQASLPIKLGGLGIQSAIRVAPSAYLASLNASMKLVYAILPSPLLRTPFIDAAVSYWTRDLGLKLPKDGSECRQKSWDLLRSSSEAAQLKNDVASDEERSRLQEAMTSESRSWLWASASVPGMRMDNEAVSIAVSHRLGTQVREPHKSQHHHQDDVQQV